MTPCQFGLALGKDRQGSFIFGEIGKTSLCCYNQSQTTQIFSRHIEDFGRCHRAPDDEGTATYPFRVRSKNEHLNLAFLLHRQTRGRSPMLQRPMRRISSLTARHSPQSWPHVSPFPRRASTLFDLTPRKVDSGTPNIIGSLQQVRDILTLVGYNITEQTNEDSITVALVCTIAN